LVFVQSQTVTDQTPDVSQTESSEQVQTV